MKGNKKHFKRRPIKDFPNYVATQDGRIINTERKRELVGTIDKDGYRYVMLTKNKKLYTRKVHRLVYEAFNGQIEKGIDIHHLNEDKSCNELKNLIAIPRAIHLSLHKKGHPTSEETRRRISESVRRHYEQKRKEQINDR